MMRSNQASEGGSRRHATAETIGRQLRTAFDPVPTAAGDFADLLKQLDAVEKGGALAPAD
jgi:hypothetical protein